MITSNQPTWLDSSEFEVVVLASRTTSAQEGDDTFLNAVLEGFCRLHGAQADEVIDHVAGANFWSVK